MKKILYTNKNLIDVLPLNSKRFSECGVDETNIIQFCLGEFVHSFLYINDEELLNENIINSSFVKMMQQDEALVRMKEFEKEIEVQREKEVNELEKMNQKIYILEKENSNLREGLQAVLSGDMQSLAYILYPKDFADLDKNITTLEL